MVTVRLSVALALALAATASPSFAQNISADRAQAIRECSIAAAKYIEHVWADWDIQTYRSCMAQRGQQE
jgi:hypothetical protein